MTLGEVVDQQDDWSRAYGSSAAGAAQFMRATLQDLAKQHQIRGDQLFDGEFQDRLAFELLKRRGYSDFMAGRTSRTEFGKRLAQEWASFPVLAPMEGRHRDIARGESFYASDGLNKSLVTPVKVEAMLNALKRAAAVPGACAWPDPSRLSH